MSEENYFDWHCHGPGSINWNRKRAKEEKAKLFSQRISDTKELELLRDEIIKLRKENKELRESQCSGKK